MAAEGVSDWTWAMRASMSPVYGSSIRFRKRIASPAGASTGSGPAGKTALCTQRTMVRSGRSTT